MAAGVVAEVLLNAGIWSVVLMSAQNTLIEKILVTILLLPLGFGLFFRA